MRSAAASAAVVALAAIAVLHVAASVQPGRAVDFYQFWGVPTAREASDVGLPTPWASPEATRRALEAHFATEQRAGPLRAHRYRMEQFEPFGSPLLYLSFAPLPPDYLAALRIFLALQIAAFAAGATGLLRMSGQGWRAAGIGASLLALLYRPFGDDIFAGNLNAIQLAAFAGLVALAGRSAPRRILPGALAFLGLGALALWKANVALVCGALGLHLIARMGTGPALRAAACALPGLALLVVGSSAYFGSADAWLAWLRFAFANDPARLSEYAVAGGNVSTPRLLAETLGADVLAAALALAAGLLASVFVAGGAGTPGGLRERARRTAHAAVDDPLRAAGLGVAASLAVLPLVWFHYLVLALIPAIPLVARSDVPRAARALAATALALASGVYAPAVARLAGNEAASLLGGLFAVTWIPLWAALLVDLRDATGGPGSRDSAPRSGPR